MRHDFLDTTLGRVTYYFRPPNEHQLTWLFIPAFGCDSTYYNFKNVIDNLAPEVGILAIDTIGTGQSIQTTMARTPDHIIDNLQAVIRAKKLTKIAILGHSLGGDYALAYAQRFQEVVQQLILIEPPYSALKESLLSALKPLIARYPQIATLKRTGEITTADILADLNPCNPLADRQQNAAIYLRAYGNASLITEAQYVTDFFTDLAFWETNPQHVATKLLVTHRRLIEYQHSPFAVYAQIVAAPGSHYLHWTNPNFVYQQLKSTE